MPIDSAPPRPAAGRWPRLALLPALLLALLAGCNPVKSEQRLELLDASIRTYEKMLRWAEYREAAQYIRPREGEAEPVDYALLESVRITRFQSIKRIVTEARDAAVILANIEFYHEDYGVVYEMEYTENWYYDETEEHWFLDGALPDFTAAMEAGGR